jgi:hypothetical protein
MTRTCALLVAIASLLVACGKYGPPKRVQRQPAVAPTAELEVAPEPSESDEDQETTP